MTPAPKIEPAGSKRRLAFVTGAARGLGRAIAERLAQDGIAVVIGDIRHELALEAAREISAAGAEAFGLALDVADESSVAAAYAEVDKRFGGLDILVNNAGIAGARAFVEEMTLGSWEETLRINLTGTFLMSRGAIPFMKRRNGGRIVNVASLAGRARNGVRKANYAATKAGMIGFSRILADELGPSGITVNCVAPGRTVTELTLATSAGNKDYFPSAIAETALGRLAEPADVAHAVAFLCSEQAGFMTGTVLDVNGGTFMA